MARKPTAVTPSSTADAAPSAPPSRAVRYAAVASLVPYANNARTHSPEQVAKIARSIETFGWTNPILVDADSGIIAGHGRLQAALSLGMSEVPVIELTGLTAVQKRAYVLADNQLALNAGWDFDILREELPSLEAAGLDLSIFANLDLTEPPPPPPMVWKAPVIKFLITFDDDLQQQAWFEFVRRLQQEYPSHETLAARLVDWIEAHPITEAA